MPNLIKCANGHLLKNAAGHLVNQVAPTEFEFWSGGAIYSYYPDGTMWGESVLNDGQDELRPVFILSGTLPSSGTATSASKLYLWHNCNNNDGPINIEVYACLRRLEITDEWPLSWPSWNCYVKKPPEKPWGTPGGLGPNDAVFVGSLTLPTEWTGSRGVLTGQPLADAINAMISGACFPAFILRTTTESIWSHTVNNLKIEIEY